MNIICDNLFNTTDTLILHQVNCMGVMGSGVAAQIKEKYPTAYESYKKVCCGAIGANGELGNFNNSQTGLLGLFDAVETPQGKIIGNCFTQDGFANALGRAMGKRYTSYDALVDCLTYVKTYCESKNITSLSIPYNFGCTRGGGNWDIVSNIFDAILTKAGIVVNAYKLDLN